MADYLEDEAIKSRDERHVQIMNIIIHMAQYRCLEF